MIPKGSRDSLHSALSRPRRKQHSWEICSGCFGEANWCWVWRTCLAAPHLFLCDWGLLCCKRNTWCLNWWILKCRLVCGWGQSILHCWGCRCSWMVHNYSLKKLQMAIEPTQTLFLLTAHAKLSPPGNDSVVILQCACSKTTHSVQGKRSYFSKFISN